MISCGNQCLTCDYPVHMDTYRGCGHRCLYCSVRRKYKIEDVTPLPSAVSLRNFIIGKRTAETKWCDWNIPLHWGANSDPFQPAEIQHRASLECLRILADSQYPFIVSTKNPVMLLHQPYYGIISRCNVVLQISMVCPRYDAVEPGAPKFESRLKAAAALSGRVRRVVARLQPLFPDAVEDAIEQLPRLREAGIHSVICDSFVSVNKQAGMLRQNGSYIFHNDIIAPIMKLMKEECHKAGLTFTCTAGGLSWLSDDPTCCGCAGLEEEFTPNRFHAERIAAGVASEPTPAMTDQPCEQPFKCIGQSTRWMLKCKGKSFAQLMMEQADSYSEWYRGERAIYEGR